MNRTAVAKELTAIARELAAIERTAAVNAAMLRPIISPMIDSFTGWDGAQKSQGKKNLKIVKTVDHGDITEYVVDTYADNPDSITGYDTGRFYVDVKDATEGVYDPVLDAEIMREFGLKAKTASVRKAWRSQIKRWNNVKGDLPIEFDELPNQFKPEIAKLLPDGTDSSFWELVIDFKSSGYSDPGRLDGENSYPPEREDRRTLEDAAIYNRNPKEGKDSVKLPHGLAQRIFDHFEKRISEIEMDLPEPEDRGD